MLGTSPLRSIKKAIRSSLKYTYREWVRATKGYSLENLEIRLRQLGIGEGDDVMVHAGMKHLKGIGGKPDDVLDLLLRIIGPDGTLLMPSLPFQTTAWHYVTAGNVTDLRHAPSAMGLISELFRQREHTLRSAHPTHPVLATGRKAREMLANHEYTETPCGKHSPFHKLHEEDGKVLLLGTGIYTNTFYHYLEEVFESQLPNGVISSEVFDIPFIDAQGDRREVSNRIYDPHFSRIRDVGLFEQQLRRDNVWDEQVIGRLQIVALTAEHCYTSMKHMVDRGAHCYVRQLDSNDNDSI